MVKKKIVIAESVPKSEAKLRRAKTEPIKKMAM
jgi:hypothetical protein